MLQMLSLTSTRGITSCIMTEVLLPTDTPIRRKVDPNGTLPRVEMISDGSSLRDFGTEFRAYEVGEEVGICYLRLFVQAKMVVQQIGRIEVFKDSRGYGPAMYLLCFERANRLSVNHVADRRLSDDALERWSLWTDQGVAVDNAQEVSASLAPAARDMKKIARFFVPLSFETAA